MFRKYGVIEPGEEKTGNFSRSAIMYVIQKNVGYQCYISRYYNNEDLINSFPELGEDVILLVSQVVSAMRYVV